MAFLDNSGDIILDAVLTDTGRLRMAQGDGSFKISKFALGDDEVNYALYNKDHASGSAYYDLEVLQTPVLEAFTNNTSNLKTKLVTMSRTNVLYMPILKINANSSTQAQADGKQALPSAFFARAEDGQAAGGDAAEHTDSVAKSDAKHYVAVDADTFNGTQKYRGTNSAAGTHHEYPIVTTGILQGYNIGTEGPAGGLIRVDHGLDTTELSVGLGMDTDLQETAFIVEMDYRLGRLKSPAGNATAAVNFIDDDNIASYYISGAPYVKTGNSAPSATNNLGVAALNQLADTDPQVFGNGTTTGPRGNSLQFRVHASQELQQSTYMFTQVGSSVDLTSAGSFIGWPASANDPFLNNLGEKKLYYIDSIVRVVGANTGYRLDIPIRYLKLV